MHVFGAYVQPLIQCMTNNVKQCASVSIMVQPEKTNPAIDNQQLCQKLMTSK